ncbi:hypothetical protein FRX31_003586 [Thalictrum thalictroides]|uniref:RNase H type-1 domain-containing protein n=1 Tax=Thalictrum thalictroides TaxID=46969 RepID=A0A7J6XCV5_THATH|nr:hypothetical protein FRX31_003586 [Thalictrum thalictroides]
MGYKRIVGVDSKQEIESIQGKLEPSWRARSHVNIAKNLMASFQTIQIKHIFRETNRCADFMAGKCNRNDVPSITICPYERQLDV